MESLYHYVADISAAIPTITEDSIVSRTIYSDKQTKVILFGFAPGQELSEHTSAREAMLYFVQGEAEITLGKDAMHAQAGTFVHMPPRLPHSILAKNEVRMLLIMTEAKE